MFKHPFLYGDMSSRVLGLKEALGLRPRLEPYGPPVRVEFHGCFNRRLGLAIRDLDLTPPSGECVNAHVGASGPRDLERFGYLGVVCRGSPPSWAVVGFPELALLYECRLILRAFLRWLPGVRDYRLEGLEARLMDVGQLFYVYEGEAVREGYDRGYGLLEFKGGRLLVFV